MKQILQAESLDEPTDSDLDDAAHQGLMALNTNLRVAGYTSPAIMRDIVQQKRKSTIVATALREMKTQPFTNESVERYKASKVSQKPSTAFLITIGVLGFLAMGLFMNLFITSVTTEFGNIAFWPVTVFNIIVGIWLAKTVISDWGDIFNKTKVIKYDYGLSNGLLLLLISPFLGIYYMCWIFSGEKSWQRIPLSQCAANSLVLPQAVELLINNLVGCIGEQQIGKRVYFSVDILNHESYWQAKRRLDPFLVVSCEENGMTNDYYVCVWEEETYTARIETM